MNHQGRIQFVAANEDNKTTNLIILKEGFLNIAEHRSDHTNLVPEGYVLSFTSFTRTPYRQPNGQAYLLQTSPQRLHFASIIPTRHFSSP